MALGRIRRPEGLRHIAPGELGKVIGLDRVPEVRTLRQKVSVLARTGNPQAWMKELSKSWMDNDPEQAGYLYVDGHVRVYHGSLAQLPRRFVSRRAAVPARQHRLLGQRRAGATLLYLRMIRKFIALICEPTVHLASCLRSKPEASAMPVQMANLERGDQYLTMKGREIFKHAVRTMSDVCQQALDANDMVMSEIDWLIPHQANLRIIDAVGKHFGIPGEKVVVNVHDTGNTSAATVPIALDQAVRDGRIRRGQNVLLTAFGSGLTSGSLLLKY